MSWIEMHRFICWTSADIRLSTAIGHFAVKTTFKDGSGQGLSVVSHQFRTTHSWAAGSWHPCQHFAWLWTAHSVGGCIDFWSSRKIDCSNNLFDVKEWLFLSLSGWDCYFEVCYGNVSSEKLTLLFQKMILFVTRNRNLFEGEICKIKDQKAFFFFFFLMKIS